jgi:hypothetical protein
MRHRHYQVFLCALVAILATPYAPSTAGQASV